MDFTVKVLSATEITHDVKCIRTEKPHGYTFAAGQATEVAINKLGWDHQLRPFTFTGLNDDPYLEFTIKCYSDHDGVTNEMKNVCPGDELIVGEPWGAIEYKDKGYFIAGGAGITPFIAIFRQLHREKKLEGNQLFFSNKTAHDIIYEQELKDMLGNNAIFALTESGRGTGRHDFIDEAFLKKHVADFSQHFYICGPDKMTDSINQILTEYGVKPEAVVFEK